MFMLCAASSRSVAAGPPSVAWHLSSGAQGIPPQQQLRWQDWP
eukprot:CAMPEP_0168432516 /NCGR_PEP_ID=MMETSP0228-20121227/38929_1 /TAXON_ID=133427 /ORGANISM="Protoceratium reticulatum, Strain CCCM 535 (=CCMP 1889)" /LENGTH=42 /DNA_ID= /DNA_START= /DNA_END= /DNA_ORIENTATION=